MKAKLLAAIVSILALCSVASAQSYSIRVEFNTNLRAGHSLESQVVESAPAGSILQVIDSFNRWLKISRNGREVWMASWVSHSRIAEGGQTAPQPASNIDNCCFVDRQCNSDQEWTDGYWAFQNGQCAAPVQSQQQTPTQPVSGAPAQVDNCCFVDRQCNTDAEWTDGYWAYQNNQCPVTAGSQPVAATSSQAPSAAAIMLSTSYMTEGVRRFLADPSTDPFNNCCYIHHPRCQSEEDWNNGYRAFQNNQCIGPAPLGTRPAIVGDDSPFGTANFTRLVNAALDLIGIHAPEWLKYIYISGAREIQLQPPDSGGGFGNTIWAIRGGFSSDFYNDPNWAPDHHFVAGYAGFIAHEACHAIQQRTYSQSEGWTNEAACVEAQLAVIQAINPNSRDVWWLRDLIANIQNPDRWWW
ncbi:MAG: SH3 domain-containing protein [Chloroflexi bacterium]|nr:SH3 domain-containing protein [Chloroflexota bacterium]